MMPNEHSIKILNQACEFAYMNCDRDKTPGVWDSLFAGKFFELTVQECIQAVYDDGQDAEYYQNRIKQHFEIE